MEPRREDENGEAHGAGDENDAMNPTFAVF